MIAKEVETSHVIGVDGMAAIGEYTARIGMCRRDEEAQERMAFHTQPGGGWPRSTSRSLKTRPTPRRAPGAGTVRLRPIGGRVGCRCDADPAGRRNVVRGRWEANDHHALAARYLVGEVNVMSDAHRMHTRSNPCAARGRLGELQDSGEPPRQEPDPSSGLVQPGMRETACRALFMSGPVAAPRRAYGPHRATARDPRLRPCGHGASGSGRRRAATCLRE